jgi:hypothetical protein
MFGLCKSIYPNQGQAVVLGFEHRPLFLQAMAPYSCSRSGCDVDVDAPQRYCEHRRYTADHCRNAKSSGSRFCTDHMECLKSGSRTPRYHPDSDEQSAP